MRRTYDIYICTSIFYSREAPFPHQPDPTRVCSGPQSLFVDVDTYGMTFGWPYLQGHSLLTFDPARERQVRRVVVSYTSVIPGREPLLRFFFFSFLSDLKNLLRTASGT